MSTFDIDFVENNDAVRTKDGYKFTRMATLTNIDFASGTTYSGILYSAINDASVPQIGEAHPAVSNCYVESVRAIALEPDYIKLEITYSNLAFRSLSVGDPAQISMQSYLNQVETDKDKDDTRFGILEYIYAVGEILPDGTEVPATWTLAQRTKKYYPTISAYRAGGVYTVTKKVDDSESVLKALNMTYQGTINASEWNGFAARTLLCTGINWSSEDGGDTFTVVFQFQYDKANYDFEAVYISETGRAPENVDDVGQTNATRTYLLYEETNFTTLAAAWA
jgi:hypothetical protein